MLEMSENGEEECARKGSCTQYLRYSCSAAAMLQPLFQTMPSKAAGSLRKTSAKYIGQIAVLARVKR